MFGVSDYWQNFNNGSWILTFDHLLRNSPRGIGWFLFACTSNHYSNACDARSVDQDIGAVSLSRIDYDDSRIHNGAKENLLRLRTLEKAIMHVQVPRSCPSQACCLMLQRQPVMYFVWFHRMT